MLIPKISEYRNLDGADPKWLEKDEEGFTVSHSYADIILFPLNFAYWNEVSPTGYTVAEIAIEFRNIRPDFNQWDFVLDEKTGETFAHRCAIKNRLPENFDRWDIVDKQGTTVRELYKNHKRRFNSM